MKLKLLALVCICIGMWSCKEQEISLHNKNSIDTISWRPLHRFYHSFAKTYKIENKTLKLKGSYRRRFRKSKALDSISNKFELEGIKNKIYKIDDCIDKFCFLHDDTKYTLMLVHNHDYIGLMLEEAYERKDNYYSFGTYKNNEALSLDTLAVYFNKYQLKPVVMVRLADYINKNQAFNKEFLSAGLGFLTSDTANQTKDLYLFNKNKITEKFLIGKSFFNIRQVEKDKNNKDIYFLSSEDINIPEVKKANEILKIDPDSLFLPDCSGCGNKKNEISHFTLLGLDTKDNQVFFDFSIIKINDNQFNTLYASKSDVAEVKVLKQQDSMYVDIRYPLESMTLLKAKLVAMQLKDIDAFSKMVFDRLQAEIHSGFIKIKANSITDSIMSAYDFDFGKAGLVGLKTKWLKLYDKNNCNNTNTFLEIKDVNLRTDNNRLSDITITGDLYENGQKTDSRVITNMQYSLSFRGLNQGIFSVAVPGKFSNYTLKYRDLLFYRPTKKAFSYFVTNQEVTLCPNKKPCFELKRRSLYDYLSLRVFLDPFGFLSKTPNGLALIEGNVTLPSNLRNYKKHTWFDQVCARFNYVVAGSTSSDAFNDRIIRSMIDTSDRVNTMGRTINRIDNLDLFRKYTYKFEYYQSIIQFENKKLSQLLHIELGFLAIGAKTILYRDTLINNQVVRHDSGTVNIHKFIPALRIKGDLRPDAIFGLNWSVGLMYMGSLSRGNNSLDNPDNPTFAYQKKIQQHFAGNYEINFYAILSKSASGGLFFRHSGYMTYYDARKYGFFPQIIVGYATNINSFIKAASSKSTN